MMGHRGSADAQAFEDARAGRVPRDQEIARLVRAAERLCESAVAEPDADFRSALRAHLLTEAGTVLVAAPSAPAPARSAVAAGTRSVRRRIAGLTATALVAAGTISLVSSSASAVPGDLLYPVKRGVESVQLAMHRSDASRGGYQLQQAVERLAEAQELSQDDSSRSAELVARSLEDFTDKAAEGSSRLFEDFQADGSESSVRRVNDFTAEAAIVLADLSTRLPETAGDAFATATTTLTGLADQASQLCTVCDAADVSALVRAVTDLTRGDAVRSTAPRRTSEDRDEAPAARPTAGAPPAAGPTAGVPAGGGETAPGPAPVPTPVVTTPPLLGGIVDPLVGGLLGDEDQDGLVPGLLDGLLGQK